MKKVLGFFVVALVVVISSGPVLATPYDINLSGVKGANMVWIWDPKKDDRITAPVTSDWKVEKVYNRGFKIAGTDNRFDDVLNIKLNMGDTGGDGKLIYAIFKNGQLKGWGLLIRNDDGSWSQIVKKNLKAGEIKTAKWRFGPAQNFKKDSPNPVPEPETMLLLGIGLVGVSFYARRRFKTN